MPPENPFADWADAPYAFPLEHVRHQYVTPFGGVSGDLQPWEVGVNSQALKANTRLVPFRDRVHITGEVGGATRPLFTRPVFTIVPLDGERPDALHRSPEGEAVFSAHAMDGRTLDHPMAAVPPGAHIIINATLSQRWTSNPHRSVEEALRSYFGDAGQGQA